MKKSLPILACLFCTFFLSRCRHDPGDTPPCFLSKVTAVTTGSPDPSKNATSVTSFEYDDKMNLIRISDKNGILTFTYANGLVTGTNSTALLVKEAWTYNANKLVSHINGVGPNVTYTEDLTYANSGKLISVTGDFKYPYAGFPEVEVLIEYHFKYAGDNLTLFLTKQTGPFDYTDSIVYNSFDSKYNPYYPLEKAIGNQSFMIRYSVSTIFPVSKNNATSSSRTNTTSVVSFNSKGYPASTIITFPDGSIEEVTYEYVNCH